jgi:hypothetical protein
MLHDELDRFGMPIFEMANLPSRVHGLAIDVKFNLLQPGRRSGKHAERVKVFRGDNEFTVDLREDPNQIKKRHGDIFLSKKEYEQVLGCIRKYRIAFLIFWYSPKMDLDELEALMRQVNDGALTEIPKDIRERMK